MKNLTFTILTLLLFYSFSNAAIVYTDINPDKTIETSLIEIDLNNDGKNDISIDNWSDFPGSMAYAEIIMAHAEIEIVGTPIPNRTYDGGSSVLNLNDMISPSALFVSSSSVTNSNAAIAFIDGGIEYTPWIGQAHKFIGFSIRNTNTNQYHYGWIEISFSSDYILTVHGYAYEDVANTSIKAGDMGGSSNSAPTDIALSNNSIDEGEAPGTTIGTLSATDQDANDSHTFTLVAGTGDDDNTSFTIDNNNLKSDEIFDYETKSSYSILVKTDDSNGGTYEQQLDININDISNANSDLITKQAIQVFPNPASSTLHVQGIQPNSSIKLVSSIGTVVYEEQNNSSDTIVNISELPTGVYWLSVSNSNNTIITRMITIE